MSLAETSFAQLPSALVYGEQRARKVAGSKGIYGVFVIASKKGNGKAAVLLGEATTYRNRRCCITDTITSILPKIAASMMKLIMTHLHSRATIAATPSGPTMSPSIKPPPLSLAAKAASGCVVDSMYSRLTLKVFIMEGCSSLSYRLATRVTASAAASRPSSRLTASCLPAASGVNVIIGIVVVAVVDVVVGIVVVVIVSGTAFITCNHVAIDDDDDENDDGVVVAGDVVDKGVGAVA